MMAKGTLLPKQDVLKHHFWKDEASSSVCVLARQMVAKKKNLSDASFLNRSLK